MKQVKYTLLAMEVICLLSVASLAFFTDWVYYTASGDAWMFQLLIVLMSLFAVILQREQQECTEEDYESC